jgi:WXG100 family type VII secretion target
MADNGMELGEGTLTRIAGIVSDHRDRFTNESKMLDGRILERQNAWLGAGGGSFFNLHQAWMEKTTKIVQALNEFEAAIRSSEKDAMTTDQDQAASFGTNLSALG